MRSHPSVIAIWQPTTFFYRRVRSSSLQRLPISHHFLTCSICLQTACWETLHLPPTMSQTTDFSFNGVPAGMRQMRRLVETGSQDHKTTDTYMNKYRYRQRKGMTRTFQNPEERPSLWHPESKTFAPLSDTLPLYWNISEVSQSFEQFINLSSITLLSRPQSFTSKGFLTFRKWKQHLVQQREASLVMTRC